LRRAGLAREVVRLVQDARKTAGLEVTDRIAVTWSAAGDVADALRDHAPAVADEVLATSFAEGDPTGPGVRSDEALELTFSVRKV
jgi:isoleucyl-tRNA synthetase